MTDRLEVRKTYKLFVGGAFPRSESGRSHPVHGPGGDLLAHVAQGSRKDTRDAVKAARGAQSGWAGRTGYNRGQILYRVAEMLEGRRPQFEAELADAGVDDPSAEVTAAVDTWVWHAGWADKIAQVGGSANPVAGPYFDFTVPEPTGVVGLVAPDAPPLLGLVSRLAPALVTGNTVVALVSQAAPLPALTLGEVLATSDLPGGVVNLLSGFRAELVPWLAGHRDVDLVDLAGVDGAGDEHDLVVAAEEAASDSVTRVLHSDGAETADAVLAYCEYKTVWHPRGL